ncbi:MAG: hypothetical protein F6K49_47380 [Moorea sp. SIO3I6]|nr:hypothetical protein [Moorena sp. SIO3I6]
METLQHSPSPVPFLVSRRVSLYEHAFLFFYLTKRQDDSEKKERYYSGAIACTQQILILKPGDLIGQLILKVIEGTQKKEKGKLDDDFIKECRILIHKIDANLPEICKAVLRYMIKAEPETKEKLEKLLEKLAPSEGTSEHKLKKLVEDVLNNPDIKAIKPEAQLWLWKNFALVELSASALSFLADLSNILKSDDGIYHKMTGEALPYRELALIIYNQYALERLFQTPALSKEERKNTFDKLSPWIKPLPLA